MASNKKMRHPRGRQLKIGHRQLRVFWAAEYKDKPCLNYAWSRDLENPEDANCKGSIKVLMEAFESMKSANGTTLCEELINRGYDMSTFRFSIEKLIVVE